MQGTILDFLNLAAERPELAKEFVELATKYDFELTDEVSDEELGNVAGGTSVLGLTDIGGAMDTNAYVKMILRHAYLEQTANLADTASQVESFNAPKETG